MISYRHPPKKSYTPPATHNNIYPIQGQSIIKSQQDLDKYIQKLQLEFKVGDLVTLTQSHMPVGHKASISCIGAIQTQYDKLQLSGFTHPPILYIMQAFPSSHPAWDRWDNKCGYRLVSQEELQNVTDVTLDQIQEDCFRRVQQTLNNPASNA